MNDTTHHDDEYHPIRKLLQSLPKIPARDDFVQRLRRRLAEEPRKRIWSFPEISPLPAYALSIAALVVAGAVLYFSLIRIDPAVRTEAGRHTPIPQSELTTGASAESLQSGRVTPHPVDQNVGSQDQTPATAGTMDTQTTSRSSLSVSEAPRATSPARQSVHDIQSRVLLKEVGGTGLRATQFPDTSPFLRPTTGISMEVIDSIARADSLRRDSLANPRRYEKEE